MRRSFWVFLLLVSFLSVARSPLAAARVHTYENGLTLIHLYRPGELVHVRIYVGTGSAYEEGYLGSGISHYVEHLLTKGSEEYGREEVEAMVGKWGVQKNAYTSAVETCYYFTAPVEGFEELLSLYASFFRAPLFSLAEMESQRKIIHNEMKLDEDRVNKRLYAVVREVSYADSPFSYPVIGYRELFDEIGRDDVLAYFRARYAPSNLLVVVVGGVGWERAKNAVGRTLGAVPPRRGFKRWKIEVPLAPHGVKIRRYSDLKNYWMELIYPAPAFPSEEVFAGMIVGEWLRAQSSILNQKFAGRFADLTVNQTVSRYYPPRFTVSFRTSEDGVELAKEVAETLASAEMTEEEFEKAKRSLINSYLYAELDFEDYAYLLAKGYRLFGDPDYVSALCGEIDAVSYEEARDFLRRYLARAPAVVGVGPEERSREEKRSSEKVKSEMLKLANGLRVFLYTDPNATRNVVVWTHYGGRFYESPGERGYSQLLAKLFSYALAPDGTGMEDWFAERGGDYEVTAGRHVFLYELALPGSLAELLEVLTDLRNSPRFMEEGLNRAIEAAIAEQRSREENWFYRDYRAALSLYFSPSNPYSWLDLVDESTVKSARVADLLSYRRRFLDVDHEVVVIYTSEDGAREALSVLEGWKPLAKRDVSPPSYDEGKRKRVEKTITMDQKQCAVFLVFEAPQPDTPEDFALQMVDAVLTGVDYPSGIVYTRLRKAGLVYTAHGYRVVCFGKGSPYYVFYAATSSPENLDEIIRVFEDGVEEVIGGGLSADDIASARAKLVVSRGLDRETPTGLCEEAALDLIYSFTDVLGEEYARRLEEVDAGEMAEVARKYLSKPLVVLKILPEESEG